MTAGEEQRHVISIRRRTGLGDHLICLAAAWRFARDTGRTLVADWRFSPYTLAAEDNLFPLCFEVPAKLAGVPFIAGAEVAALGPQEHRPSRLDPLAFWRRGDTRWLSHRQALAHIRSGRDLAASKLIIESCVNHGITAVADLWDFFSVLTPVAVIASAVSAFRAGLPSGPVIGLHVRHGNGATIPGYALHWRSFASAIARCLHAVDAARASLGQKATVCLCTDSMEVEKALRARIPNLFTRPKMLRDSGEGELHLWRGSALARQDALVEMLLLAQGDALVRYPPASFFSFYGAVMKHGRGRQGEQISVLQEPWDASDHLSPALLLSPDDGFR